MVVVALKRKNKLGTFKRRLIELLEKSGIKVFTSLTYKASEDRLYVDDIRLTTEDKLLVILDSDSPLNFTEILKAHKIEHHLLNDYYASHYSKPEQQCLLKKMSISTPDFTVSTKKAEIPHMCVAKHVKGEKGNGVELSIGRERYFQEWIRPPDLGTVFDYRIYLFLNSIIGTAVRIASPRRLVQKGNHLWGITNTEHGGRIHFPYEEQTNANDWSKEYLDRIMDWLKCANIFGLETDAIDIANGMGLSYLAVDFIFDGTGKHYVIDINPNAAQGKEKINLNRLRRARDVAFMWGLTSLPKNYVFNIG